MVAPGQFLERPTVIPVGGVVMEALSHRGDERPSLLVLSPLPQEGGGMDHVLAAEVAWAAARAGFPTLRFNWRGVGASQGLRGDLCGLLEDARAAIEAATQNGSGAPFVAAIGAASSVAIALAGEVAGICLVNPPQPQPGPESMWVVVAQSELSDRWSVATERLIPIPGADRTFRRNLPLVGKAVVRCLNAAKTLE